MDIRKLRFLLAFVLAASIGAFACGDDDPEDNNGTTCEAPTTLCDGACVDTSKSDAHCGECNKACADGETCVDSTCVTGGEGCTSNDDCEPGEECNEEGQCVPVAGEDCESDDECTEAGEICVNGNCIEGTRCTEETVEEDCGEGQVCVDGLCADDVDEE